MPEEWGATFLLARPPRRSWGASFALRPSHDLRLGEEIEGAGHRIHGAAPGDLEQRAHDFEVVGFRDAARHGEGAAKGAEGGLGAWALLQIRHLARADPGDKLGQIDALDR